MKLPDLEVEGLDSHYNPVWHRRPFWKAIRTAIWYKCRLRFARATHA